MSHSGITETLSDDESVRVVHKKAKLNKVYLTEGNLDKIKALLPKQIEVGN